VEALFDGTGWAGCSTCSGAGAGRLGGVGMYSSPVWPQPDSVATTAVKERSARVDFTIRITV